MSNIINITNIPNDIHELIIKKIENGNDIYNFKNTCKVLNDTFNRNIKLINVNLFKINYVITFNNSDINKHSFICKRILKVLKHFKLKEIHINRKHDSIKSIFDTQTIIYVSIMCDNLYNQKNKLIKLLEKNNLKNYDVNFTITIYFTNALIEKIINDYNKDNCDVLINNVSLQKLDATNDDIYEFTEILEPINDDIYEFTEILEPMMYEYKLQNNKLFITKKELINFLVEQIKLKEKEIEDKIVLMESTQNDLVLNKIKTELLNIIDKMNNIKDMIHKLQFNIIKNEFGTRIIKSLEKDFELVSN
jgi:hypothetical protein